MWQTIIGQKFRKGQKFRLTPACQLDIQQVSEFATGYGYPKNCFQTDSVYGYPKRFYRFFEDSDFWKKLNMAQSFIHYLQKHFFSLLCHDPQSVYAIISVP